MHTLYMQSSIHAASCRPFLPGFRRDSHHLSSIYTFSACACMSPYSLPLYSAKLVASFPKSCHMQPVIHHIKCLYIYIYVRAMVVEIISVVQAVFGCLQTGDQAFAMSSLHSSRAVFSPSRWISATSSESSELGAPVGTVKTSSWAPAGDDASPVTSPLMELADVM
jgi:hypothetical protein